MALGADGLRELLKSKIHGDDTVSDPAGLNRFLTLAQRRIVRDCPWGLGVKEGTITTVASTQASSLASDFYEMSKMWYPSGSRRLYPVPSDHWVEHVEANSSLTEGEPQYYHVANYDASNSVWKVRFYPVPSGVLTVKYWYHWFPSDITGSGTTAPDHSKAGWDELLLWAATMMAREENDPEGFLQAAQVYERNLQVLRRYSPQGADDSYRLQGHMARSGAGGTLQLPPDYPRIS